MKQRQQKEAAWNCPFSCYLTFTYIVSRFFINSIEIRTIDDVITNFNLSIVCSGFVLLQNWK